MERRLDIALLSLKSILERSEEDLRELVWMENHVDGPKKILWKRTSENLRRHIRYITQMIQEYDPNIQSIEEKPQVIEDEQEIEILQMFQDGMNKREIADRYHVSDWKIRDVIRKHSS
jgi:predicted DNA-binding protein (UPF0251 family)